MTKEQLIKAISLPPWKQNFIRKNRLLYTNNRKFIDTWLKQWKVLDVDGEGRPYVPVSRTKYEWQAGPTSRTNWENIFQFRPSGIRVKRGDYFPALVAMAQIPVVGWLKRHISPNECARIQDFDVDGIHGNPFVLGASDQQSYKQLGNAVNVNVVKMIQERIDFYIGGNNPSILDEGDIDLLSYKNELSKEQFEILSSTLNRIENKHALKTEVEDLKVQIQGMKEAERQGRLKRFCDKMNIPLFVVSILLSLIGIPSPA
jgi:hypothetical protein